MNHESTTTCFTSAVLSFKKICMPPLYCKPYLRVVTGAPVIEDAQKGRHTQHDEHVCQLLSKGGSASNISSRLVKPSHLRVCKLCACVCLCVHCVCVCVCVCVCMLECASMCVLAFCVCERVCKRVRLLCYLADEAGIVYVGIM